MAPRVEWVVVAAAFAFAVPLWLMRGRTAEPGDVVEEPITLVPEDEARLACLLDHKLGRYSCAYRTEEVAWDPAPAKADLIMPCMTTGRRLYLVPGLFEEPAVRGRSSQKYGNARFTARCKLRLVSLLSDYELRFASDAPWGREAPAWLAEPLSCTVE